MINEEKGPEPEKTVLFKVTQLRHPEVSFTAAFTQITDKIFLGCINWAGHRFVPCETR